MSPGGGRRDLMGKKKGGMGGSTMSPGSSMSPGTGGRRKLMGKK
eukprot:CAMPEP_0172448554 /NCGR_PEP_ID=MMETSP1065-20121228/7557_1 /TAXON_ID=265537 /ORGANISM="Amphiprora paludosa, Strain CCMP125" /LENGTH=43 /DNA_ID= /DNA_START= /DNA_END= /DNA_ORIENTATION=